MNDKEILCEVRENLDDKIKYIAEHCEPSDYYRGLKSAFEDIARIIDNYVKAEEQENE